MSKFIPERGDIIHLDFDPTLGNEQRGKRYALVLTLKKFNRFGTALVAPITTGGGFARINGFGTPIFDCNIVKGLILSNQVRMVDYEKRGCQYIETAPLDITEDVLAKVQSLIDFE